MTDPTNWNTKLSVKLDTAPVTPVTSFTPTFTTAQTPLHSIEADNVGTIQGATTYSFVLVVAANSPAVATLTGNAITRTPFTLTVSEESGTDWAFKSLTFEGCQVTQALPSSITVDGVPQATFTCLALRATAELPS
ncbi:MAG TPA: hypothetical protein VIP98_11270 [Microlunatus sp.]